MKRFALVVLIIMCALVTACQSDITEEQYEVTGVVSQKYVNTDLVRHRAGNRRRYRRMFRYCVTVTYEDVSTTFEDKELFDSLEEGDEIQVILSKSYDKEGKEVKTTLKLPEEP